MRRERGFTLLEVVITLAVFGVFLWIIVVLTADMNAWQKRMPVNYMTHPQVSSVLSRLRKDVLDATNPYYPATHDRYTQAPDTLILYTLQETGFAQTVVWDFTGKDEVWRRAFSAGAEISAWVARGVPKFRVTSYEIPDRPPSVRIQAVDEKGTLAIDQVLQPRPHR